jgi:hypothetical protein
MGVLDNVKEVADLVKKMGDIDLYRKIVHAEGEVMELTRQLRSAEERVRELEGTLLFKDKLAFKAPYYFAEGDIVPYCPRCWEGDKRAIHLVLIFTNTERTRYDCPQCDKSVVVDVSRGGRRNYGEGSSGGPDSWMR